MDLLLEYSAHSADYWLRIHNKHHELYFLNSLLFAPVGKLFPGEVR